MAADLELAEIPSHNDVRQRKGRSSHDPRANTRPFAGRIGGNQEFTVSPSDSSFVTVTEKVPDAAALFSWRQSLACAAFSDVELWKQATIEGFGTCVQIYIAGLYAIGLIPATTATSLGPIVPAAIGSFMNFLLISLFIYSAGPVSGGHFNPFITISTFFARLSSLPRTVLYVLFQCTGSVIAGFMVRASLGTPPEGFRAVPGCYIDTSLVTPGQAYALETMTALALIFIAFGVGLDPRQQQVFG
jgi:glycerol uptake facilitator-like aquaporin